VNGIPRTSPLRIPPPGASSISKAIILAAGNGHRFRPFTDRLPKCLAPVNAARGRGETDAIVKALKRIVGSSATRPRDASSVTRATL
jgi:hypothetical protein